MISLQNLKKWTLNLIQHYKTNFETRFAPNYMLWALSLDGPDIILRIELLGLI